MGHAYTPGLKVTEKMLITKRRILPLKGEVLAKVGDKVQPDTVVARTFLPGPVEPMNVANILSIAPEDVPYFMLKKEGEKVQKNFGRFSGVPQNNVLCFLLSTRKLFVFY